MMQIVKMEKVDISGIRVFDYGNMQHAVAV